MSTRWIILLVALLIVAPPAAAQQTVSFPLGAEGRVPAWLVAGPFDQPVVGFGVAQDADVIGEATAAPVEGEVDSSTVVSGGVVAWKPVSARSDGLVDFHAAFSRVPPDSGPHRIWWARAGYAVTYLESDANRQALLLLGSNAGAKVFLNGQVVYDRRADRTAVPDADTLALPLRAGRNTLLVKVWHTHRNEEVRYFEPMQWVWGFYARLRASDGGALSGVRVVLPLRGARTEAALASTFFFKHAPDGALLQRFDLTVTRRDGAAGEGSAELVVKGRRTPFPLGGVPFGESRHALYIPAVTEPTRARLVVRVGGDRIERSVVLRPERRYELHLMLLSHTDIGYTHPQPIVKERHVETLDSVLALSDADSAFHWTVETPWQLEQYEQSRPPEVFERLMRHVQAGRIAVSPLYGNPYTGWVSTEEMIRSLDLARSYATRYGLRYPSAIYNDTPGFSWLLPQVLEGAGISFFVTGLNELFNDYAYQRRLPKVFLWEGAGGSRVLTYRTESYIEAQFFGLFYGKEAMEDRATARLRRLEAQGYPYDLVLVSGAYGDNGGVAAEAYRNAQRWNAAYAFPRFVVSDVATFARRFTTRNAGAAFPVVRGDWTSTWDVLFQGELARVVRQREAQRLLPMAETLSTLAWMTDRRRQPLSDLVRRGYRSLLHYSGHGSGLEYGYGTPEENALTMAYREAYVQDALLDATEALTRATYRLVRGEESFEGEGVYVFNTLSWQRDAPVTVSLVAPPEGGYRVTDLASGQEVPTHLSGATLRFVARDLPALGFKKFRLQTAPFLPASGTSGPAQTVVVENGFYRLEADPQTGALVRLLDRKTGRELIGTGGSCPFGVPLVARPLVGEPFKEVPGPPARVSVQDESPVRRVLVVERPGSLVERAEYVLWEGIDRIDAAYFVSPGVLAVPASTEEYGIAFPFALDSLQARLEVGGSFLDPDRDLVPGTDRRMFALHRAAALFNATTGISWAATDTRVVRVEQDAGRPVLMANLINNFPPDWNRHEENRGVWPLRFSFRSREGGRRDAATARFGWEAVTPAVVRRTWLRADPPSGSLAEVSGEGVVMLAMLPSDDGKAVLIRLQNTDGTAPTTARVALPGAAAARRVDLFGRPEASLPAAGGAFRLSLMPGELATIRVDLPGNDPP